VGDVGRSIKLQLYSEHAPIDFQRLDRSRDHPCVPHTGSGKSSLLKIIAGVDKNYDGEAAAVGDIKIGYIMTSP